MPTTEPETRDRATLLEWTDLAADGALAADERALLLSATTADPALGLELRRAEQLQALLERERVDVRAGFTEATMASLPRASWESGRRLSWALPLAMTAFFAFAAAVVLGLSGALANAGPWAGTGGAVIDFVSTALLAGGGLLGATWTGVGLGLEELFARSELSLVGLGLAVLMIDLLLVAMLRRRRPVSEPVVGSPGRRDEG